MGVTRLFFVMLYSIALLLGSCKRDIEPELKADFNFDYEGDCSSPVLEVHFENLSDNATSYLWNFGDGTTSTEIAPTKVYDKAGTYIVALTAYSSEKSVSASKEVTISRNSDGEGPVIEVSFSHEESTPSQIIFLITLINASSYKIDFGDGGTPITADVDSETTLEIVRIYPGSGRYQVILFAYGNEGASCFNTSVQF
jgi:PKD repeat protein